MVVKLVLVIDENVGPVVIVGGVFEAASGLKYTSPDTDSVPALLLLYGVTYTLHSKAFGSQYVPFVGYLPLKLDMAK